MGLMQRALETYDAMHEYIGKEQDGKETLAPISHIITNAEFRITINSKGEFISAEMFNKKIPIPVFEKSAGRSGTTIAPHPLCEQLGYITPELNMEKYDIYCEQLKAWINFDKKQEKLKAVYAYVTGKTILSDLAKAELIDGEDKTKNEKSLICWSVVGIEDEESDLWKDKKLMNSFIDFYQTKIIDRKETFCFISGEIGYPADQHMKGVVSKNGNAKIISSNDSVNYTYRGRFTNPDEALSVSYEASQKSHNALKWLISTQGVLFGEKTFLCWNPHGYTSIHPHNPFLPKEQNKKIKPTEYKEELIKALNGYKATLPDRENVIVAAFDAATSGRLSVSYYNELRGSDFLERLLYWDETCSWYDNLWGTSSPSLYQIMLYSCGTQRGTDEKAKVEVDSKVVGPIMERLIRCRIDKTKFPEDIMLMLLRKADNMQIYTNNNRRSLLFISCAVIKKYRNDKYKEEWKMALEPEKKDRSYQFGRLLAILEKIEKDALGQEENRETNAIRMQSVFSKKPMYATKIIKEQLEKAYMPRLSAKARTYYNKLIAEIMMIISDFPDNEINKELKETYILGYYLQQNELYKKKETEEE